MTDHGKFRPLEEVATHSRSSASPEAMEPDAQYILLEHIVSGTGEVEPSTVAMHKVGSNKARYEASDVLYGKLRPNLRKDVRRNRTGLLFHGHSSASTERQVFLLLSCCCLEEWDLHRASYATRGRSKPAAHWSSRPHEDRGAVA